MDQKVMVHGVTRPSLSRVPPNVKQEDMNMKVLQEVVRHTVKAVILKRDQVCKDLIFTYFYDNKPVYFLTHACKDCT